MTDEYGGYYKQPPSEVLKRQLQRDAQDAADRMIQNGAMKVRRVEVTIHYTDDSSFKVTSLGP